MIHIAKTLLGAWPSFQISAVSASHFISYFIKFVFLNLTAGIDFVTLNEEVTFGVGATRMCVNVTILDDEVEEGDVERNLFVRLSPGTGGTDNLDIDFDILYEIIIEDSDGKFGACSKQFHVVWSRSGCGFEDRFHVWTRGVDRAKSHWPMHL